MPHATDTGQVTDLNVERLTGIVSEATSDVCWITLGLLSTASCWLCCLQGLPVPESTHVPSS